MITGTQLYEFLAETTKGHDTRIFIHDGDYSLPDDVYIERFGRRFRNFMFSLGAGYKDEAWDCDNFVIMAVGLAKLDHGLHTKKATELGIGMASVAVPGLGLHKLVAAVRDVDGKRVLSLYEPQQEGTICMREFTRPVERFLSLYF